MAICGSTNAVLHLPAIANEAELDMNVLEEFEALTKTTPQIAKVNPAAKPEMEAFYRAGGIPRVMQHLGGLLDTSVMTVSGKTLAENLAAAFGRPAWDISFHVNMDAASLIGMDTFVDGAVTFRPGPVYRCAQCGGFGVLDEINDGQKRGPGCPPRRAGLPPRHRCARLRPHPAGGGDPLYCHQ